MDSEKVRSQNNREHQQTPSDPTNEQPNTAISDEGRKRDHSPTQIISPWHLRIQTISALLIAVFTGVLTYTATEQWRVSRLQWETIEKTMRLDQRAWVGATSKDMLALQPNRPMKAKVVLKNTGRTPALNTITYGKLVQVNERWTKERFEAFRDSDTAEPGTVITPNSDVRSLFSGPVPKIELIRKSEVFVYFLEKSFTPIFSVITITPSSARSTTWTKGLSLTAANRMMQANAAAR